MNDTNILKESTLKLKTKVLIFSGISLFIGLTKSLPTKLSLIGLSFKNNEKILGWFLISITIFLCLHFIMMVILDLREYFKGNIINKQAKNLTSDIIGLTHEEISEEYHKHDDYYNELYENERTGSLSEEAEDIKGKTTILENSFDLKHIKLQNIVELFFNVIAPMILAIFGLLSLCSFLIAE